NLLGAAPGHYLALVLKQPDRIHARLLVDLRKVGPRLFEPGVCLSIAAAERLVAVAEIHSLPLEREPCGSSGEPMCPPPCESRPRRNLRARLPSYSSAAPSAGMYALWPRIAVVCLDHSQADETNGKPWEDVNKWKSFMRNKHLCYQQH